MSLKASEAEFADLISLAPTSYEARLFRQCLMALTLKAENSIKLLGSYPQRAQLVGKVQIVHVALWVVALNSGFAGPDLYRFLGSEEHDVCDPLQAFS